MSNVLETLVVELAGNVARLQKDMGKAAHIMKKTQRKFKRICGSIGVTIGAAFSVRAFHQWIGGAIDVTERLEKLSQSVGVSVENLSTLGFVARLSGTNVAGLEMALKGFGKRLDDTAKGRGEAVQVFKDLGVAAKDSTGRTRDTTAALLDVADAFSRMEDGATKSALAQRLFEESGMQLIPFLNQGSAKIKKLQGRARELGAEISTNTAKQAAAFKDAIEELSTASRGAALVIASKLVPGLTNVANAFIVGAEKGDIFKGMLGSLKAIFTERGGLEIEAKTGGFTEKIKLAEHDLEKLKDALRAVKGSRGGLLGLLGLAGKKKEISRVTAAIRDLEEKLGGLRKQQRASIEASKEKQKTDIEYAKTSVWLTGLDADLAEIKKALTAEIKEEGKATKAATSAAIAAAAAATKLTVADEKRRLADRAAAEKNRTAIAKRNAAENTRLLNDAYAEREQAQRAHYDRLNSRARDLASTMSQHFAEWTQTGKFRFRDMVNGMLADMIKLQAMRHIFGPIMGGLFGGGAAPGREVTPSTSITASAKGNVFTRASATMIAEQGRPEAVLPLARGAGGRLGVQSSGGGTVVQIIDQRQRGAAVEAERTRGGDGREIVRVLIRDEVKSGLADGTWDGDMSRNYGVRRSGVSR